MRNLILLTTVLIAMASCTTSKKTDMKSVNIQLIRNATLKLKYNGKTFLVDPVLGPQKSFTSFVVPNKNLNPTVDMPLSTDEIVKDIDAILVTHTHEDHFYFDDESKQAIDHSLPLFAQAFDKEAISKSPFNNVTYIEDKHEYEDITIVRTKGKHGPEQLLEDLGKVSGFILQAKDYPTVYIVGDCLFDEEIKKTIKKYQPEIIITNSGSAQWGGETILMDDKNTVELAKFAPKAKIVAVHMEALDHCIVTRKMLIEKAKEEKVKIYIPKDGETIIL